YLKADGGVEFGGDLGFEAIFGSGAGFNVHVGIEYKPCCVDGHRAWMRDYNISGTISSALGFSFKLNTWWRAANLSWKLLERKKTVSVTCSTACGEELPNCCKLCGSLSFAFPALFPATSVSLGILGFSFTAQADISISINACY